VGDHACGDCSLRSCGWRYGSRYCANAHLSDDEAVAKMGHPVSVARVYPPDHVCGYWSLRLCGVGGVRFARGANAHRSSPHQRSWRGPRLATMKPSRRWAPSSVAGLPALSRLGLAFLVIQLPRQDTALASAREQRISGQTHLTLRDAVNLWRLMGGDVGLDESERRRRLDS
jgi:hypothetical protein